MKNESKNACINDQSSCTITSERIGEENPAQIPHAKPLKDTTSEQRKKEASKPIYLVRYE
jgi:hypothetical protein